MTFNVDVGYGQIDIEICMGLHNRYITLFQCLYDGQRYSSLVRKKKGRTGGRIWQEQQCMHRNSKIWAWILSVHWHRYFMTQIPSQSLQKYSEEDGVNI
jgi:hypothetical protein